jgi:hypothetical protein
MLLSVNGIEYEKLGKQTQENADVTFSIADQASMRFGLDPASPTQGDTEAGEIRMLIETVAEVENNTKESIRIRTFQSL